MRVIKKSKEKRKLGKSSPNIKERSESSDVYVQMATEDRLWREGSDKIGGGL